MFCWRGWSCLTSCSRFERRLCNRREENQNLAWCYRFVWVALWKTLKRDIKSLLVFFCEWSLIRNYQIIASDTGCAANSSCKKYKLWRFYDGSLAIAFGNHRACDLSVPPMDGGLEGGEWFDGISFSFLKSCWNTKKPLGSHKEIGQLHYELLFSD